VAGEQRGIQARTFGPTLHYQSHRLIRQAGANPVVPIDRAEQRPGGDCRGRAPGR